MIKIRIVNNTYANNMNHTKFIASPKVQVHFAKYIKEKNTTCGIETAALMRSMIKERFKCYIYTRTCKKINNKKNNCFRIQTEWHNGVINSARPVR